MVKVEDYDFINNWIWLIANIQMYNVVHTHPRQTWIFCLRLVLPGLDENWLSRSRAAAAADDGGGGVNTDYGIGCSILPMKSWYA